MGQDLLDRFNSFFEGEIKDNFEFRMFETIKYAEGVLEASVVMDATDPGSKVLKKLLKKHKVTMEIIDNNGPSGWPEVELTGSREDLQSVLASDDGWGDPELGEYIEESNETFKIKVKALNEAEVTSDEEFKEYAFSVLQKAFGDDFDEAKAQEVVDGLISKNSGDYGAMVGALKSSLG
jgi:hypothetical protein